MPYHIVEEDGKYHVRKEGSDKDLGEHESEADAKKQLAALHANEEGMGKKSYDGLPQSDVNYRTLSDQEGRACSNCFWFRKGYEEGYDCRIVHSYPFIIVPNGLCDRWEAPPPPPEPEGIMTRAFKALVSMVVGPDEEGDFGFRVLEGSDAEWIALWSNNFEDRKGEIFSFKAMDDYVERVRSGETPMPVLRFQHIPLTESGRATNVGRLGHMMWATGKFNDDEMGQAFKAYYAKNGPWKMSHGYKFFRHLKKDGVYHHVSPFEITVLPENRECNSLTLFKNLDGSEEMAGKLPITEEAYKDLEAAVGPEKAKTIRDAVEKAGDQAYALGLDSKANDPAPDVSAMVQQAQAPFVDAMLAMANSVAQLNNRLEQVEEGQKGLDVGQKSIQEFLKMTPTRPTRDPQTKLDENNPMVEHFKSHDDEAEESILDQIMAGKI